MSVVKSVLRYVAILSVTVSAFPVALYLPNTFIYAWGSVLVFWRGYEVVSDNTHTGVASLASFAGVALGLYTYLSSSGIWFDFYGTQVVLVLILSILVWILASAISDLIVGSIIFGDIGTYTDEMEKNRMKNHSDPYGDKHAQDILNGQDS